MSYIKNKVLKVQEFTGNGTWTRPAGVDVVYIFMVGGGGGGGGGLYTNTSSYSGGGGGGAGAAFINFPVLVTGNVSITIGTAGTAGAVNNGQGGNGGDTSFGSLVASGGYGAGQNSTNPFEGGYGGNFVKNISHPNEVWWDSLTTSSSAGGCPGGVGGRGGSWDGGTSIGASSGQPCCGFRGGYVYNNFLGFYKGSASGGGGGGSSAFAVGGSGGLNNSSILATAGTKGSGGGGGGAGTSTSTDAAGAAGGAGWCLVTWWE